MAQAKALRGALPRPRIRGALPRFRRLHGSRRFSDSLGGIARRGVELRHRVPPSPSIPSDNSEPAGIETKTPMRPSSYSNTPEGPADSGTLNAAARSTPLVRSSTATNSSACWGDPERKNKPACSSIWTRPSAYSRAMRATARALWVEWKPTRISTGGVADSSTRRSATITRHPRPRREPPHPDRAALARTGHRASRRIPDPAPPRPRR